MTGTTSPSAWLDRFFDWYYRTNPVSATFIGVHDYDTALPTFHASDTELDALLGESQHLSNMDDIDPSVQVDVMLARSYLWFVRTERQSSHLTGNPCLYTGEAVFSIVSLFLREFATENERLASAAKRLHAIPDLLNEGRASIADAPAVWVERAIRECVGADNLLRDGLPLLMAESGEAHLDLIGAIDAAVTAFADFRVALESRSLSGSERPLAIGQEQFDWMLRYVHFLNMSGEEITAYARRELEVARQALDAELQQQGFASWDAAAEAIAADHPSADQYLRSFETVWRDARQYAIDRDLVTWPDTPIAFEPIPEWARTSAPYLYFLYYRCPPPFDDGQVQRYLVPPLGDAPDAGLRSVNSTQVTLNHVIHHAGLGHHVQNWYAARARSRVGQIAGNDTALRIALPSAGTFVEGWACYATDLMEEAGFLTPLQVLSMRQSRLRMAARAIADVAIHTGEFSIDDAVEFYAQEAGMDAGAAHGEAVKNSMFPTMAMMYLIGTDLIHDLRAEMMSAWGDEFSLRRFHDEFLSWGAIPVALVARLMKGEAPTPGGFSRR